MNHTQRDKFIAFYREDAEYKILEGEKVIGTLQLGDGDTNKILTFLVSTPDLLEALEQIAWKLERKEVTAGVMHWAKIDRNDAVMRIARKAIKQAKGRI